MAPWVEEMARSFKSLKAVHFRRMIVRDEDIEVLVKLRGEGLVDLKIDRCSGFSTDGLMHIGQYCKYVVLSLRCDFLVSNLMPLD